MVDKNHADCVLLVWVCLVELDNENTSFFDECSDQNDEEGANSRQGGFSIDGMILGAMLSPGY